MPNYALAVDIGGTFTDVVLRDASGQTWVDKTLTTPESLDVGFFRAVDSILGKAAIKSDAVTDVVVHATTVVTNAVIERKGPLTALIVTEGFRDILTIKDEHRYEMFDPQIEFPEQLVSRDMTFGVPERVLATGEVMTPLDKAKAAALVDELKAKGVVSVAISFLNAYLNPANERAMREIVQERAPAMYVSISSDVAPQIREYPRTSTAVMNAYTAPITGPYLDALRDGLKKRGFANDPLIMLSNGGVIGIDIAKKFPVRMVESGPAAGALAAAYYAEVLGLDRLLSFDMGGTTAKACIIEDRHPLITGDFEVDRIYRFKSGSGLPILIPSVDMIEIGAGGGSIASVSNLGLLKVGPQSAGSTPGPVAYGRGGQNATVTDADLVLGYLSADNFLGGDMKLDLAGAEKQLAKLGEKLGTSTRDVAAGIYRVVGESMTAAARAHAVDRGIDYRGVPLFAFGGAGPVHACYVADLLESPMVIYPPLASVLSAFGTLVTPPRLDLSQGALSRLSALNWDDVDRVITKLVADASAGLASAGCKAADLTFQFGADLRYFGQQNEVTAWFDTDPRKKHDATWVRSVFEDGYEKLYSLRLPNVDVEIVSWRLVATGPLAARDSKAALQGSPAKPTGKRSARFNGRDVDTPVYARKALAKGQAVDGPAIIEERETTIIILPGWRAKVDATGCIMATKE
ncbi:hydantoinase/oxoprolinase family protein [Pseudolabrys taiwanensis]|uniref:Hydantoinase/oxoprolinase family protein n=1 Tax=Pseudolabrys taiwanensis TaxID=331696 RepID=A0A346A1B0_9HYPH|nr:hydantoinase/oxoprolinase family protein [Pseudolabrys taiwanensis]AXK82957.1 hydantoinase/oxoprolinase family protein [Pseudolabrys taiwanensis]